MFQDIAGYIVRPNRPSFSEPIVYQSLLHKALELKTCMSKVHLILCIHHTNKEHAATPRGSHDSCLDGNTSEFGGQLFHSTFVGTSSGS